MDTILQINNLTYKNILVNLDLKLKSKTLNLIIGNNSCGKSTLVYAILGLCKYNGFVNLNISASDISVVSDKNILLDGNVLYNLEYPLLNLGKQESEARHQSYEMSKQFQMDSLLFKDISSLKNSEIKLVEIAVALISNPKLLIIDDSLDTLNYKTRKMVLSYLVNFSKESCVLILSNNAELACYATDIFIFNSGKIDKCHSILDEEDKFTKQNIRMPFVYDIQSKLKLYGIVNKNCDTIDELVEEIWN